MPRQANSPFNTTSTRTYGSGYVEKQWNTRIAQEVEA